MYKDIDIADALRMKNKCLLDVRSPAEFREATIPGAVNIPLFDDDERRRIGITYEEEGPAKAKLAALKVVAPRLVTMVETILRTCQEKTPVFFCWRGGMRSRTLVGVLELLDMKSYRIKGGYRAFRRLILHEFASYNLRPQILVLDGLAGVGKTTILRQLGKRGHPVLDLEGLAGHRGSVFGGLGAFQQRGQKMFDGLLWKRLQELNKFPYFLVEGEGKRIGRVYLPDFLYSSLVGGKRIKVEASVPVRVERILQDYTPQGQVVVKEIEGALDRLVKRLGKALIDDLKSMLEEGNLSSFVEALLVKYYDPLYRKSQLPQRNYELIVGADEIVGALEKIEAYLKRNYYRRDPAVN